MGLSSPASLERRRGELLRQLHSPERNKTCRPPAAWVTHATSMSQLSITQFRKNAMTKKERTPEEQRILDRLKKSGPIEGTEELCLDQARALGILPQLDSDDEDTLDIDELSREIFSPERMSNGPLARE